MRDIKFEDKELDRNIWISGNLVYSKDARKGWEAIIIPQAASDMFCKDKDAWERPLSFERWYRVDINTVRQYTGLKDRNGKEIYEGDIMLHNDGNWGYGGEYDATHDGYLKTLIPSIEVLLKGEFEDIYEPEQIQSWEVIGDIYDNPELLEGQ